MSNKEDKQQYDSEPVLYCSRCYSLKIKYEDAIDSDCCMECGCSDVKETSIENWERMYQNRYGHKYTEKGNDPRKHPIFKKTIRELKDIVYNSPSWKKIVYTLYPRLNRKYGRTDAVLLLFDKLMKENKLDELKLLLYNMQG